VSHRRRSAAAAFLALLWLVLGVAVAGPASAHASLVSSDPPAGAHLDGAPTAVRLTFSEHVSLIRNAIRLLDGPTTVTGLGTPISAGSTVTVPINRSLADGDYLLVYRVVSADTHVVGGSIPFRVGAGGPAAVTPVATGDGAGLGLRTGAGVDRWVAYLGAVGLLGVPAFVLLCWPAGGRDRLVRLAVSAGALLVILSAAAGIPLQAAGATGGSLRSVFSDGGVRQVLRESYGQAMLARICFAVVLAALLARALRRPGSFGLAVAGAAGLGLALNYARTGHAAVGEYPALTLSLDAVHLLAVAVWLGGLLVLGARLLPRPPRDCARVLQRWSGVAMAAVAVLVASGVGQAWRELPTRSALVDERYGRLLLLKAAGLVVLVALGNLGRVRVRRYAQRARPPGVPVSASLGAMPATDPGPAYLARLRASVALESAIAAGVLAVSAALVVTSPRAAASPPPAGLAAPAANPAPVGGSTDLPTGVHVDLTVSPGAIGSPTIDVVVRGRDGAVLDPPEIDLTAALPQVGVQPITLNLTKIDSGHYRAAGETLPIAGTWTFTVTVRTSDIDAGVGAISVPLGRAR
jgi:copper transport protein